MLKDGGRDQIVAAYDKVFAFTLEWIAWQEVAEEHQLHARHPRFEDMIAELTRDIPVIRERNQIVKPQDYGPAAGRATIAPATSTVRCRRR